MPKFLDTLLDDDPKARAAWEKNAAKRAIATAIRQARRHAGMTQAELAAASGLDQAHISRLEAPTGAVPDIVTMQKLVEGLGEPILLALTPGIPVVALNLPDDADPALSAAAAADTTRRAGRAARNAERIRARTANAAQAAAGAFATVFHNMLKGQVTQLEVAPAATRVLQPKTDGQ